MLAVIALKAHDYPKSEPNISTPDYNIEAFRKLIDTRIQEITKYKPTDPQEESLLIPDLAYNQLKIGNNDYIYPKKFIEEKQELLTQKKKIESWPITTSSCYLPNFMNVPWSLIAGIAYPLNNSMAADVSSAYLFSVGLACSGIVYLLASNMYAREELILKAKLLKIYNRAISSHEKLEAQFRHSVDQTKTLLQDCIKHPTICKEELAKNRPDSLLHNIEKKLDALVQEEK